MPNRPRHSETALSHPDQCLSTDFYAMQSVSHMFRWTFKPAFNDFSSIWVAHTACSQKLFLEYSFYIIYVIRIDNSVSSSFISLTGGQSASAMTRPLSCHCLVDPFVNVIISFINPVSINPEGWKLILKVAEIFANFFCRCHPVFSLNESEIIRWIVTDIFLKKNCFQAIVSGRKKCCCLHNRYNKRPKKCEIAPIWKTLKNHDCCHDYDHYEYCTKETNDLYESYVIITT